MKVLAFLLGVLSGFALGEVWVLMTDRYDKKSFFKGYHFHHNLFAVPLFLIAFFTQEVIAVVLLGSGIGLIIQHTYREGFKFITKE